MQPPWRIRLYTHPISRSGARPLKLIFIYGLPATGKLTVATELARLNGYKLFHNHLAVDLLLSVFEFGSEPFIELRESIWLSVFERAARTNLPGLIFTFAPESTVNPQFIPNLTHLASRCDIDLHFVELTCPLAELKQRLDTSSRRAFQKLTSQDLFDQLHSTGCFSPFPMPTPELTLDTSRITPPEAARRIAEAIKTSVKQ